MDENADQMDREIIVNGNHGVFRVNDDKVEGHDLVVTDRIYQKINKVEGRRSVLIT